MIRVVLADDHAVFRQGLSALLRSEPGIELAGEASTGRELDQLVSRSGPDVAVVDVSMPEHNLPRLLSDWRSQGRTTRVIALTQHAEPRIARSILAAGVDGYVLKASAFEDLLAAIRTAAAGGRYVSPSLAGQLLQPPTGDDTPLTPREEQVLKLIAAGLANKQIARQIGISIDTVRTHRNRLMDKLDLHSAAELTRYAIEHGLA